MKVRTLTAALVPIALLVAAACSGDDDDGATSAGETTPTSEDTTPSSDSTTAGESPTPYRRLKPREADPCNSGAVASCWPMIRARNWGLFGYTFSLDESTGEGSVRVCNASDPITAGADDNSNGMDDVSTSLPIDLETVMSGEEPVDIASPVAFYHPSRLLTPSDQASDVESGLQDLGIPYGAVDGIEDAFGVTVLELTDVDPLEVSYWLSVQDPPIVAAPDYAVALSPRVMAGPGGDPEPVDISTIDPHPNGNTSSASVVVLDTGYSSNAYPNSTNAIASTVTGSNPDPYVDATDPTLTPPPGPMPFVGGHGGFVAGLIAQGAPHASIEVRALTSDHGRLVVFEDDVLKAAAGIGASMALVNMSFGTYVCGQPVAEESSDQSDDEESSATRPPIGLFAVTKQLADNGIIVTAAAGNDATDQPFYPAAFSQEAWAENGGARLVHGVGALDVRGDHAEYSNTGVNVTDWAYGDDVSIYPDRTFQYYDGSTKPIDTGFARWQGTSFASANFAAEILP